MEESFYEPLNQRPSSCEIPSDSHLIEFDLLVDIRKLNEVSNLLSLLPVEQLRKFSISINVVKMASDQLLSFFFHDCFKFSWDIDITFCKGVCQFL